MDPIRMIDHFYGDRPATRDLLIRHSRKVAGYALALAARKPEIHVDERFVEEAAMLHDIGILHTHAPVLGCCGVLPYIAHGYMGRRMLEDLGFPRHALVCERHVGCGLTATDIRRRSLPLPERDMLPVSIEERLICYADKFFSKKKAGLDQAFDRPFLVRTLLRQAGPACFGKTGKLFERMRVLVGPEKTRRSGRYDDQGQKTEAPDSVPALEEVIRELARFGEDQVNRFKTMHELFASKPGENAFSTGRGRWRRS